jgi:PadR family transcriptional regulator PadR
MRARLGLSAIAVLQSLANGRRHGFDIIGTTGLGAATVYPTLGKLQDAGFVASTWEDPAIARKDKRPARRYYTLRPDGRRALADALERLRALQGDRSPARVRRADR